ncbi:MAG: CoA transferase, partial [Candidatus Eremiobacteraeota bacterium]|nr:CoA transferase [Candidatus Eremiobacteraeota bacterium]
RALGAQVRQVEPPAGAPLQKIAAAWYDALHRGCSVKTLDLKTEADRRVMDGFLAEADVLLTSSRPSSLERIGLGWEALRVRHPRLVQVAIVGEDPPHVERAGHDLTYVAQLGLLEPPAMPRTLLADLAGAERAVTAACGLLLQRERHGSGGFAFVSLRDAAVPFGEPAAHGLTSSGGRLGGGFAGYRIYRARDGWIALAALEPQFWRRLHDLLDLTFPASSATLDDAFAERDALAWQRWGETHDIPLAAIG